MHYINYLLVIALVAIAIALIVDAQKHAQPKPHINDCPACGALAAMTGDFIDHHVRCSNLDCAMAGPKGSSEAEAISNWNNLPSMSTIVAWQFQAAGLALALQRLVDSGQSLSNAQYLAARISSFGPAAKEVGEEFDTALADARNALEARHG